MYASAPWRRKSVTALAISRSASELNSFNLMYPTCPPSRRMLTGLFGDA